MFWNPEKETKICFCSDLRTLTKPKVPNIRFKKFLSTMLRFFARSQTEGLKNILGFHVETYVLRALSHVSLTEMHFYYPYRKSHENPNFPFEVKVKEIQKKRDFAKSP